MHSWLKRTCPFLLEAKDISRKIVVVLPYRGPHRGGVEAQQSMIHLGVLERLKKQVVLRF